MGIFARGYLAEIADHQWTNDTVTLVTHRNSGVHELNTTVIKLSDYGLNRGGLFEEVIRSMPCPILSNDANLFERAIKIIARNESIRQCLNTPSKELSSADLTNIARAVDEVAHILVPSHPYEAIQRTWKIFKGCPCPIKTGEQIADLRFKSKHAYKRGVQGVGKHFKTIISDKPDPSFEDPEIAAPISAIPYQTPAEQIEKSLRHLNARLNRIEDTCVHILDTHTRVKDYLLTLTARGLPDCLSPKHRNILERGGKLKPKAMKKINVEAKIQIYLFLIERDKHYTDKQIIPNLYLDDAEILTSCLLRPTSYQLFNILISPYFLPAHVITACYILVAIATAWNRSTLMSLADDGNGIRKKTSGYELTSVKPKTDKIQTSKIEDEEVYEDFDTTELTQDMGPVQTTVKQPAAVRALEMLTSNTKQIVQLGHESPPNVFSFLRRMGEKYEFTPIRADYAINELCIQHNLKKFSIGDIRDQVAAIDFLKNNQNIYSVQSLLAHSNVEISAGYLATTIFHALHEANINRFSLLLQNDILYATGRSNQEENSMRSVGNSHRPILFPISHLEDNQVDCGIDKWLASQGNMQIVIGMEEIRHCAYQYRYYVNSMQILIQNNCERFIHKHLPRIVVCYALYKIIQTSPYNHILKKFEKEL